MDCRHSFTNAYALYSIAHSMICIEIVKFFAGFSCWLALVVLPKLYQIFPVQTLLVGVALVDLFRGPVSAKILSNFCQVVSDKPKVVSFAS